MIFRLGGVRAANVRYQHKVLDELPKLESTFAFITKINKIQTHMLRIQEMEKARKSWILPAFGLDVLEKTEKEYKKFFSAYVMDNLVVSGIRAIKPAYFAAKARGDD